MYLIQRNKPILQYFNTSIPATVGTTVRQNLMSIYTDLNVRIVVDQNGIGIRGAEERLEDGSIVAHNLIMLILLN